MGTTPLRQQASTASEPMLVLRVDTRGRLLHTAAGLLSSSQLSSRQLTAFKRTREYSSWPPSSPSTTIILIAGMFW